MVPTAYPPRLNLQTLGVVTYRASFGSFFLQDENGSKGYFEVTLSVKEMDAKPFRKGLQRAKIMTHKVAKERIEENSVLSPMRGQS